MIHPFYEINIYYFYRKSKTADFLVDVDEILWNPSKFQDVISTKKMRIGRTNKLMCQLCINKKVSEKIFS